MSPTKAILRLVLVVLGLFILGAVLVPVLQREGTDTRDLTIPAGRTLYVHADRGSVTVHRGPARVTRHTNYILSAPSLDVTGGDDQVKVDARCPAWAFVSCSTDLDVTVPAGTPLTVVTERGPITVRDASGAVDVHSDLAPVTVTGDPTTLAIRSVEDTVVSRTGTALRTLKATSETGDIRVTLAGGTVRTLDVRSNRGAHTVTGVREDPGGRADVEVRSGAGDVTVDAR